VVSVDARDSGATLHEIYVSVGSNVDRERNIRSSVRALREAFGDLTTSPVYKNPAVGFDGDDFLNLAVRFASNGNPGEVRTALRSIEQQHGRQRHGKRFAPRTLDIDFLLYDDLQIDRPDLRLPRFEITEYAFILAPLADIAADLIHPRLGVSIGQLWRQFCRQNPGEVARVRKIPFSFGPLSA
jgi:2-amino-4-hydroxy-6-hydroxymethyldihydropteridine diphosphokinase